MGGKPNNKQEKETPLKSKGKGYNKEQMINGKLRDEIFNTEIFLFLTEVLAKLAQYLLDYNSLRPPAGSNTGSTVNGSKFTL